jgi:hypothetical protein
MYLIIKTAPREGAGQIFEGPTGKRRERDTKTDPALRGQEKKAKAHRPDAERQRNPAKDRDPPAPEATGTQQTSG